MIIEKVARILDYFNKEKIVRIILMLFEVIHPLLPSLEREDKRGVFGDPVRHQRTEHFDKAVEPPLG